MLSYVVVYFRDFTSNCPRVQAFLASPCRLFTIKGPLARPDHPSSSQAATIHLVPSFSILSHYSNFLYSNRRGSLSLLEIIPNVNQVFTAIFRSSFSNLTRAIDLIHSITEFCRKFLARCASIMNHKGALLCLLVQGLHSANIKYQLFMLNG
jgi:hypothetical protein